MKNSKKEKRKEGFVKIFLIIGGILLIFGSITTLFDFKTLIFGKIIFSKLFLYFPFYCAMLFHIIFWGTVLICALGFFSIKMALLKKEQRKYFDERKKLLKRFNKNWEIKLLKEKMKKVQGELK